MNSSLIALGSNLLVYLNICKAIRTHRLIVWLFNGTPTQKLPTYNSGNPISTQRINMIYVCYYNISFFLMYTPWICHLLS